MSNRHGFVRRAAELIAASKGPIGGGEFVVADTSGVDVAVTAERIRREIAEAPFAITASIGAAIGPLDSPGGQVVRLDDLILTADTAMYEAKRAGGNRVVCLRAAVFDDVPIGPDALPDGLPDK